jgi:hypothetical protein
VSGSSPLTRGHASQSLSDGRTSLVRVRVRSRYFVVRDGMRLRRSRRGCLVRVGARARSRRSVEQASYETGLMCGLRWAASCSNLVTFVFYYRWMWVPLYYWYRQTASSPIMAPQKKGKNKPRSDDRQTSFKVKCLSSLYFG